MHVLLPPLLPPLLLLPLPPLTSTGIMGNVSYCSSCSGGRGCSGCCYSFCSCCFCCSCITAANLCSFAVAAACEPVRLLVSLSLSPSSCPSVFALAFRATDYQQTPQFARHEANASSSCAANCDCDCDVCCTCCLTEIRRALAQVASCGSRVADCQLQLHKSLQQMWQ